MAGKSSIYFDDLPTCSPTKVRRIYVDVPAMFDDTRGY